MRLWTQGIKPIRSRDLDGLYFPRDDTCPRLLPENGIDGTTVTTSSTFLVGAVYDVPACGIEARRLWVRSSSGGAGNKLTVQFFQSPDGKRVPRIARRVGTIYDLEIAAGSTTYSQRFREQPMILVPGKVFVMWGHSTGAPFSLRCYNAFSSSEATWSIPTGNGVLNSVFSLSGHDATQVYDSINPLMSGGGTDNASALHFVLSNNFDDANN